MACRNHGVTVNTALIAAFALAQNKLNPESPKYLEKYASAANIRNFLINPIGEQFGFFAGGIEFKYKYSEKDDLWTAAKKIFKNLNPTKTRKQTLIATLNAFLLPSSLMDAQFYGAFGHLIPKNSTSYEKMQCFINDEKNIAIKMIKKRLSSGVGLAQIMTNLGNLNFPNKYGELVLESLILMPSCSPYTELVLGVVTYAGTLSVTLNHMESTVSSEKISEIKSLAHKILMNAIKN